MKYHVTKVHRISPRPEDQTPQEVEVPDGAFSDSRTLARALRTLGLLPKGGRVNTFRVEGDKTVVFPSKGWHSITLQA